MPRTVAVLHGGRIAKLHGNDAANTHLLALQNFNQCCSKQPLDLMSEPSHSSIYIYIHICTHIYIYIYIFVWMTKIGDAANFTPPASVHCNAIMFSKVEGDDYSYI